MVTLVQGREGECACTDRGRHIESVHTPGMPCFQSGFINLDLGVDILVIFVLFLLSFIGIIFRDIRCVFCVHFISVVGNCGVCIDDPNNLSWQCLLSFNITVL